MKTRASVMLPPDLLRELDRLRPEFGSRSEVIELAARRFLAELRARRDDAHDLQVINERSDTLNAQAEDVLTYRSPRLSREQMQALDEALIVALQLRGAIQTSERQGT